VSGEWLTEPRRMGPTSAYRLGTTIGARRDGWDDLGWVFENQMYASVELDPWRLSSRTKLRPQISNLYSWDTGKFAQNAARAELHLDHRFDPGTRMGVNYYYTYRTGQTARYGSNHLLSLDFTTGGAGRWSTFLNATLDLTQSDRYASAGVDYNLGPGWRLGLFGTYYDYDTADYSDLELELARALGNKELGLRYSMETGRLSLELGGFGLGR